MTGLATPYFVARPERPTGRGIVLGHEGLGLTAQILRFAERLAGEGYTVAAPDFMWRTGGPPAAPSWEPVQAITDDGIRTDLRAAVAALRALGVTSIGATGFCLGGRVSYLAARWADDVGVDAVVSFYGRYAPDLGALQCPALLLFAGKDEYIPREDVDQVAAYHGDIVHVYEENGHAFMRDDDPHSYDPQTAADAWDRMLAFFGEHLTPPAAA
jgi:carboxymethylenebutenolidase